MPGPQQQQQDCPTGGDCPSLEALLTHGVCKEEFQVWGLCTNMHHTHQHSRGGWMKCDTAQLPPQAFDSCFDEAHAKGSNEDACTPLVSANRLDHLQHTRPARPPCSQGYSCTTFEPP
jgi:hypothetical protein